jgi:hypothetical protein
LAYRHEALFAMVRLRGRSFDNRPLPDFLGTFEVNTVPGDVGLTLLFVPLEFHP